MPNVTMYTRNRIQSLHESCLQPVKIFQELKSEEACGCFYVMLYSVENLMRNLMRPAQSENEKNKRYRDGSLHGLFLKPILREE